MTPESLIDQLKRDEGLKLNPYKDSVGKLTIGYGRNLADKGISKDEADYLLASDIAEVKIELARALPWSTHLNLARQGVLQNMAFNMGLDGLLQFDRTLELVESGRFEEAAGEMLKSKWAKQVKDRAFRLADQMKSGEWV